MFGPLGFTLAPQVKASRGLYKFLAPIAQFYARNTGHRQMGLRYDDLLIEERGDVQKAISRLPEDEAYNRAYRQKVAVQQSLLHKNLPKEQWLKPENDIRYLRPYVEQVVKEDQERAEWDTITVTKAHH
ncbi:Cytochrome b-c1 complex subunit, partial [Rhizoctonia solani]